MVLFQIHVVLEYLGYITQHQNVILHTKLSQILRVQASLYGVIFEKN